MKKLVSKVDLSWGNPEFLYPYWINYSFKCKAFNMSYKIGSLEELKNTIKLLHKEQNNALIDDKYIIVGHGATQILSALINVLGSSYFAIPPYFSRFPILAGLNNKQWNRNYNGIQIITQPNNPDGRDTLSEIQNVNNKIIYDLSYNWKQYTDPLLFDKDIMVYSLAKATGHASTRIGWCIVRDKDLANKLEQYIEYNTSGISMEAQSKAIEVIKHQLINHKNVFDFGKKVLDNRWKKMKTLKLPFDIMNDRGMFLYCKGYPPSHVEVMMGSQFGDTDEYFRINLGCSEEKFNFFIKMYE